MEIAIGIVIILAIMILIQYNGLVKMKKEVEREASTIDVYLTQRFDLIPNLVECVKAYAKHEKEVLAKVTELRTSWANAGTITEKSELDSELSGTLKTIMAVSENYPDLKASEQFLLLQEKLSKLESQLQAARRLYNGTVTAYNTKISVVPTNIIAGMFGFKEAKLFEVETPEAKESVTIKL